MGKQEALIMELLFGDCLELMEKLPENSIDLLLCDLPYGITANKWDSVIPLELLWSQYKRICKPETAIVLTASQPFTSVLVMSNLSMFRYEWIWQKNTATGFMSAKRAPLKQHENIVVFYEKQCCYNPQMEAGLPYKKRRNGNSELGENYAKEGDKFVHADITNPGVRYPVSCLPCNRVERGVHPTQKPVELMEYLIKTYSNPNAIVLDNCMGSGTTGVAAIRTGRDFIGMESNEAYFAIAKQRVEEAYGHTF